MDLEIKTRHFQLWDEVRERIEAQFDKVVKFSPRPVSAVRLQISHENNQFHCDGVLSLRGQDFRAENVGAEPDLATQGVADNLHRQLDKFKGKISGKQRGEEGGLGRALGGGEPETVFEAENFTMQAMDALTARESFTGSGAPFLVFRNSDTGRVGVVYRREDGDLGLMEADND